MTLENLTSGPCLLIALPQLQTPFFSQTTILLTEFNQQGAMGFVLNRPLGVNIDKLIEGDLPARHEELKHLAAFWGGPVQTDRGFVIHEGEDAPGKDSVKIAEQLFMSGTTETLSFLLGKQATDPSTKFRLFLGYAGWGPKQLEKELSEGSWLVGPLNKNLIFDDHHDEVWKKSFKLLGVDPLQLASSPQKLVH